MSCSGSSPPGARSLRMLSALRSGASGLRSSCASVARNSSLRRSAIAQRGPRRCARSAISRLQLGVARGELGVGRAQRFVERCQLARLLDAAALRCAAARRSLAQLQLAALAVQLAPAPMTLLRRISGITGTHDVVDRAELVAAQAVEVGDVDRGDEDDRRLLEARMLVDQARGLEAVHARHVDVEQDHRELVLHQLLQRFACRSAPRPGARRAARGSRDRSAGAPAGRRPAGC